MSCSDFTTHDTSPVTGIPAAIATGTPAAIATGIPAAIASGIPAAIATGIPAAIATGIPAAIANGIPAAIANTDELANEETRRSQHSDDSWEERVTEIQTPNMGTGMIASRDLECNETCFIGTPFAIVVVNGWIRNACRNARCCKFTWNKLLPIRCNSCTSVAYCSASCQTADERRHAKECSALSQWKQGMNLLKNDAPTEQDQTLARLLISVCFGATEIGTWDSSYTTSQSPVQEAKTAIGALVSNREKFSDDHISLMIDLVTQIEMFCTPSPTDLGWTQDDIVDLICQEECNSFGLRDDTREMFGYSLVPLAARFNHSCEPNLRWYRTPTGVFKFETSTEVKQGQQLLISYAHVESNLEERSMQLSGFHFVCECPRCLRERIEDT